MTKFKIVFEETNYTKWYKGKHKLKEFDIALSAKVEDYFEGCEEAMIDSLGGFKIEAKVLRKD